MAKKDFLENATYRDIDTSKFITNWITTLKKKKKIVVEQFVDLFCKCGNINYPIEIKLIKPGFFKIFDDKNNVLYFKCHPYEDKDIDCYSIVIGIDEFIYRFSPKGEVNLKGIMEAELDPELVADKPKEPPVDESKPADNVEPAEVKNLSEILRNQFSYKLTDADYEILGKWFATAVKSKSMDEFTRSI